MSSAVVAKGLTRYPLALDFLEQWGLELQNLGNDLRGSEMRSSSQAFFGNPGDAASARHKQRPKHGSAKGRIRALGMRIFKRSGTLTAATPNPYYASTLLPQTQERPIQFLKAPPSSI